MSGRHKKVTKSSAAKAARAKTPARNIPPPQPNRYVQEVRNIIGLLIKNKSSEIFKDPPSIVEYTNMIKQPISLNQMLQKAMRSPCGYASFKEFDADMKALHRQEMRFDNKISSALSAQRKHKADIVKGYYDTLSRSFLTHGPNLSPNTNAPTTRTPTPVKPAPTPRRPTNSANKRRPKTAPRTAARGTGVVLNLASPSPPPGDKPASTNRKRLTFDKDDDESKDNMKPPPKKRIRLTSSGKKADALRKKALASSSSSTSTSTTVSSSKTISSSSSSSLVAASSSISSGQSVPATPRAQKAVKAKAVKPVVSQKEDIEEAKEQQKAEDMDQDRKSTVVTSSSSTTTTSTSVASSFASSSSSSLSGRTPKRTPTSGKKPFATPVSREGFTFTARTTTDVGSEKNDDADVEMVFSVPEPRKKKQKSVSPPPTSSWESLYSHATVRTRSGYSDDDDQPHSFRNFGGRARIQEAARIASGSVGSMGSIGSMFDDVSRPRSPVSSIIPTPVPVTPVSMPYTSLYTSSMYSSSSSSSASSKKKKKKKFTPSTFSTPYFETSRSYSSSSYDFNATDTKASEESFRYDYNDYNDDQGEEDVQMLDEYSKIKVADAADRLQWKRFQLTIEVFDRASQTWNREIVDREGFELQPVVDKFFAINPDAVMKVLSARFVENVNRYE